MQSTDANRVNYVKAKNIYSPCGSKIIANKPKQNAVFFPLIFSNSESLIKATQISRKLCDC